MSKPAFDSASARMPFAFLPGATTRRGIIAVALAGLLLGAGCSAIRLGYGQLPQLAYWWLDGYLDFNDAQATRVKAALAEGLRWHRSTRLDDAVALLQRARAEVAEPATAAQVCGWYDVAVDRVDGVFDHFVPTLAELAPTFSAAQLQHLERKYEKNRQKFAEEFLQDDPAKRLKAAVERTVDRAQTLYGTLDRAQRERIEAAVAQSPYDPQAALDERQRFQRDLVDTLRRLKADAATPAQAQAALRAVALRLKASPTDSYRAYQQRLMTYNCAFGAQIHNATSTEQRQRAAKKLKGWEDDLRSLMPDA